MISNWLRKIETHIDIYFKLYIYIATVNVLTTMK